MTPPPAADKPSDPRRLRPSELCRLLNSTPLGQVLNERQLYRHRSRAGAQIGDGRSIDLVRYAAWLAGVVHDAREGQRGPTAANYQKAKEKAAARNRVMAEAGREIGALPPVADPARRAACERDFLRFCISYLPASFPLPFSADHREVGARIEEVVLAGGLYALAMPRGSGKTTLCEAGGLFAIVYGHRHFVVPLGSDAAASIEILDSIKRELETNELLLADFPEVCFPIHCLEGIANRAKGQLYQGQRTHIVWRRSKIILPTIPGSRAAGTIVQAAGLLGRVRGVKHKLADGTILRPDLVIPDDPQTDRSAASPQQCARRERILSGAVLGLAGPGQKIAAIMPCTVITAGDMADRMLDRDKHPRWQGQRMKLLYSFPDDMELWDRYKQLRRESLRAGNGGREATEFYRTHQAAMDRGAVAAWAERFEPDELSAVQHAMNRFIDDPRAFFAECQNDPLPDEEPTEGRVLTEDEIAGRVNQAPRRMAPLAATVVVSFIDVHAEILFYAIAALSPEFDGAFIDYGTWPDQRRAYFSQRDPPVPLSRVFPGYGLEAQIYAGLAALTDLILPRDYEREDGAMLRIERCLIDEGWKDEVVHQFCRESKHGAVVMPSKGFGVKASQAPFSEYKKRTGDKVGHNWRVPNVSGKRITRHVIFDTNFWKSFHRDRWATPPGGQGALMLFGREPSEHRLFAEHLTSEYFTPTSGRGRRIEEWDLKPGRENHWGDCGVGCMVAGSMQGCELPGTGGAAPVAKARKSFAAMQRRARGGG